MGFHPGYRGVFSCGSGVPGGFVSGAAGLHKDTVPSIQAILGHLITLHSDYYRPLVLMCCITEAQGPNHQTDFNLLCQAPCHHLCLPKYSNKAKIHSEPSPCRPSGCNIIWLCNEAVIVSSQTPVTVRPGSSLYTNRERDPLGSHCGFHERAWKPFGTLKTCSAR